MRTKGKGLYHGHYTLGENFNLQDGKYKLKVFDLQDKLENKESLWFVLYDIDSDRFFSWCAWVFSPYYRSRKNAEMILSNLNIEYLGTQKELTDSVIKLIDREISVLIENNEIVKAKILPEMQMKIEVKLHLVK